LVPQRKWQDFSRKIFISSQIFFQYLIIFFHRGKTLKIGFACLLLVLDLVGKLPENSLYRRNNIIKPGNKGIYLLDQIYFDLAWGKLDLLMLHCKCKIQISFYWLALLVKALDWSGLIRIMKFYTSCLSTILLDWAIHVSEEIRRVSLSFFWLPIRYSSEE
jgi:hypothetical protein